MDPVPVPTFGKVMVPVPVPTFEKFLFRFRIHKAKSYGSYGSGSTTLEKIY
jgi:hypothetical protein